MYRNDILSLIKETIEAYRQVTATDEFREIERQRSRARHDEASALGHARREGIREGEQKQSQEIAKRALNEGMHIEVIQKISGLNTDTIRHIQAELEKR